LLHQLSAKRRCSRHAKLHVAEIIFFGRILARASEMRGEDEGTSHLAQKNYLWRYKSADIFY
jgi:hypothetical protein